MELSRLSDEKLAAYMQEHQGEGLEFLVDRYQLKLERYVKSIIKDSDQTEDVLQETFISVYKNINSFNSDRKFSPWIYRIAHNKAVSELRRRSFFFSLDSVKELEDERLKSANIEKGIDQKRVSQMLQENISCLPLKYREVIFLRYFEDKSYEEISEILQMPKGTVGVRITRGAEILKRKLNIKIEDWL
jgi:RNA polymerase sigma-70 factor (ECF subfamily)